MNLEELKAKAEAATPGPWTSGDMIRPDEILPHFHIEWCWDGESEINEEADHAFIAVANPQAVLALVRVVEALRECDSLSPWEQVGDSFTERCRECGSDRPWPSDPGPAHFDFCPWPKLVKAREELEGME